MKRKFDVNDDFFDEIDSEEKAYLLGFFLADGTYGLGTKCTKSYRFQIKLQEEDKCIVDYFRKYIIPSKELSYKAPYIDKNNVKHKGSYTLRWTSNIMNKHLEKYNITPRKTYDIDFSFPFEKINKNYLWDFIRGFFDGDGQVSYSYTTHLMTFALYGTSYKFMSELGSIFEKEFNVEKRVEGVKKSNMILYTLRFKSNFNKGLFINKLYTKFYKNKKLFLDRKQIKLLDYLLFKYRDNYEDCERLRNIVEHRD